MITLSKNMNKNTQPLSNADIDRLAESAIHWAHGSFKHESNTCSDADKARIWAKVAVLACDKGDAILGISTKPKS